MKSLSRILLGLALLGIIGCGAGDTQGPGKAGSSKKLPPEADLMSKENAPDK